MMAAPKPASFVKKTSLSLLLLCFALTPLVSEAQKKRPTSESSANEIAVQLFGQKCTLQGPVAHEVLRKIHSVSPEQNPPPRNKEELRVLRQKIQGIQNLPQGLERYQEKLVRYLDSRSQFFKGMDAYAKSKKKADFVGSIQSELLPSRKAAFLKQIEQPLYADLSKAEVAAQIEMIFLNSISPSPDEEFHRAIQRMNVWYSCSMEEEAPASDASAP